MFTHKINYCSFIKQKCSLCGIHTAVQSGLCEGCHADLPWLISFCPRCALPLPPGLAEYACAACRRKPPCFDHSLAAFRYDFPLSQILPALKYRRKPNPLGWLGQLLATYLKLHHEHRTWPDAIIPVPIHLASESKRGFNQARLLASVLAREIACPVREDVHKIRPTPHQAELDLQTRRRNLADAFAVECTPPAHVALVDDVMTTGTTVNTLAGLLKQAGAQQVDVWVLARTPEVR